MADYVGVTEMTNPNHARESSQSTSPSAHAVTIAVTTPPVFYNTSPATPSNASTPNVQEEKNGSICQNCGISGPAPKDQPRCFPNTASDMRLHHFVHPKAKESDEDKNKEKHVHKDKEEDKPPYRLFWKVIFVLLILGAYAVSIVYIVIPVNKYLNQDPTTAVTIGTATKGKPIPLPAVQICNFNWGENLKSIHVYYTDPDPTLPPEKQFMEITPQVNITKMDDYGYDFECFEINNHVSDNIMISSKRQGIIVIAEVPIPKGVEVVNDECGNDLCDPELLPNATLIDINPANDALGISIAFYQPDGKPRRTFEGEQFITSGTYSQMFLTLTKTYKLGGPEEGEQAYTASMSSIRFKPNAYALNYTANTNFKMDEVVYLSINYGELSFTEIRESLAYEAFNAFGDATAILGFFTGFGFYGGLTFIDIIRDYSNAHPAWAKIWHSK